MKLCILVYNGIELWDFAFPYEILSQADNIDITLISRDGGEIVLKDKNTVIGGLKPMTEVDEVDVLWICEGEESIEELRHDDLFKIQLARLSRIAKKVFVLGAASMLFSNIIIGKNIEICSHPHYEKTLKKTGVKYSDELFLTNEKYITSSARVSCIYMVMLLLNIYFGEKIRDKIFNYYNFDINLILKYKERDHAKRARDLKKLYKKNIKTKARKNSTASINNDEDIAIYLTDYFDVMGLAAAHSILSNHKAYEVYIIADNVEPVYAKGGGFYIRPTHSLDEVTKIGKLIIAGSVKIRADRTNDKVKLLKLSKITNSANKVLALNGSEKLIHNICTINKTIDIDNIIVFSSIGSELYWIKNNLENLTNEYQAELLKSEYY